MARVWVGVDCHYLWHATKAAFGNDAKIDFVRLQEQVEITYPRAVFDHYAYVVMSGEAKFRDMDSRFMSLLKNMDYKVRECPTVDFTLKRNDMASSVPVALTVDVLQAIQTYDAFTFVTGDATLIPLIQYLKTAQKPVGVFTFRQHASFRLMESVDSVHMLSDKYLFSKGKVNVTA